MSFFTDDWLWETYFNLLEAENSGINVDSLRESFYREKVEQRRKEFAEQMKKEKEEENFPHLRKVTVSDKDGNVIKEYEDIVTPQPKGIDKPRNTDYGQDL